MYRGVKGLVYPKWRSLWIPFTMKALASRLPLDCKTAFVLSVHDGSRHSQVGGPGTIKVLSTPISIWRISPASEPPYTTAAGFCRRISGSKYSSAKQTRPPQLSREVLLCCGVFFFHRYIGRWQVL
jgi:hypothetical protein